MKKLASSALFGLVNNFKPTNKYAIYNIIFNSYIKPTNYNIIFDYYHLGTK